MSNPFPQSPARKIKAAKSVRQAHRPDARHTMKVGSKISPLLLQGDETDMCLLYSILFGEGNGCGCRGREREREPIQAPRGGCSCGDNFANAAFFDSAQNSGCCCCQQNCCNRDCGGFGRHGGYSVCCDEEYYNRQYALCCNCNCKCTRRCSCCGNTRNN